MWTPFGGSNLPVRERRILMCLQIIRRGAHHDECTTETPKVRKCDPQVHFTSTQQCLCDSAPFNSSGSDFVIHFVTLVINLCRPRKKDPKVVESSGYLLECYKYIS